MLRNRYLPYLILGIILILGGFLRLYRIEDYMGFLGDEGRDALIVKRMIVDGEFTLLGPITSVGLMHLGPIYYYFMAPFLWAWGLNPVGPAIMVALFSLATIILIWRAGKEFFTESAGLVAAVFYALSPLVIIHSHSSWNPNILPFWALLLIYSLLKITVSSNYKWFVVTGITLGVVLQLHYIALVFIPIIGVTLLVFKPKMERRYYLAGFAAALVTFSPYILFELRHQFINTTTVWQFAARGGDAKTFGFGSVFYLFWDLTVRLFWRLIVINNAEWAKLLLFLVFGGTLYLLKTATNKILRQSLLILGIWFLVGIGFLSLYTGSIYDYYLIFAFPLPFLLTGVVLTHFATATWKKLLVGLVVFALAHFQLNNTPILKEPNRLAFQSREISQFILEKTPGRPYNFALIAAGNSDHAYRYFLEIGGHRPVVIENAVIDPQRKTVTEQLFVVCEEKICQPLGHSLWEIAGFGRAEIENEWQVGLFKIFKLVRYQGPNQDQ